MAQQSLIMKHESMHGSVNGAISAVSLASIEAVVAMAVTVMNFDCLVTHARVKYYNQFGGHLPQSIPCDMHRCCMNLRRQPLLILRDG